MVPYFEVEPIRIWGPLSIQPFGLLVCLGCVTGYIVAARHARSVGLDRRQIERAALWALFVGFLVSYWVSVLFDDPWQLLRRPLSFWDSMSSFGGFFGGALGAWAYLKQRRLPLWGYLDSLALGLTTGWLFGRLGCSLVHDHPGVRSSFVLAVRYPDGPRHDLGLYEWWYTILLVGFAFWLRARKPPCGTIVGALAVSYAPARFLLDFLRVGETRYLGLTTGQYFSVALLVLGLWILARAPSE